LQRSFYESGKPVIEGKYWLIVFLTGGNLKLWAHWVKIPNKVGQDGASKLVEIDYDIYHKTAFNVKNMALIEPSRREISNPKLIKKHSASLRFWHWTNALIICGSLLTVLLNATLFDVRDNTVYIQKQLKDAGAVVNEAQARNVALSLEDKVWTLHIYLGYALVAFLLLRLIAEFKSPEQHKFLTKLRLTYATYKNTNRKDNTAGHELIVKSLYLIFYVLITIMAITGLCLAFDDLLAIDKTLGHSIKEVHGFCMYLIIAFIAVHIIGVLLAERKDSSGIVSDMIHGGKINYKD